jgi:hypothetical protein
LRTDKEENKQTRFYEEEGIVFWKLILRVLMGLRSELCESKHDTKVTFHIGYDKTKECIRRNFYWPGMNEEIVKYIQSWPKCQSYKAAWHKSYSLL